MTAACGLSYDGAAAYDAFQQLNAEIHTALERLLVTTSLSGYG